MENDTGPDMSIWDQEADSLVTQLFQKIKQ